MEGSKLPLCKGATYAAYAAYAKGGAYHKPLGKGELSILVNPCSNAIEKALRKLWKNILYILHIDFQPS